MRYREKDAVVEAVQWFPGVKMVGVIPETQLREDGDESRAILWDGIGEKKSVRSGDWIVKKPSGDKEVYSKLIFDLKYEPVDEVSELVGRRHGEEFTPMKYDEYKIT